MSESNKKEEEKAKKKTRPNKYKEKLKIDKDFDEVLKIASKPPKKKDEKVSSDNDKEKE